MKLKKIFNMGNNKKTNKSIKGKLMSTLTIGIILLLSLTGIIIALTVNNRFTHNQKEILFATTDGVNHEAYSFFQRYITIAEQMATDKTLQSFLVSTAKGDNLDSASSKAKNAMSTLTDIRKMEEKSILFAYIAEEDPSYYLDDSTGFSDPSFDLKTREYYAAIKNKQIYISEPHKEFSTNKMVITIAAPVYVGGNIEGLAALDITIDALSQVVGNSKLGETGYFSLLSNNNTVTWHKDSDNILKQADEIGISENLLQNIKNQNTEILEYTYNNESLIGNITEIGNTKWKIISSMPMDEFTQNTKQTVNLIIIIYILTIILLSSLMYVIIGIVTKPIKKITHVTNKLADGELNVDIDINSNDELGVLAKSIDSLTNRLKSYIVYIDESVEILGEFAKGNLEITLKNDYDGEFAKLKDALLNVSNTQKKVIKRIKDSSEFINHNSEQISSGAQTLAQGTTEQASAIEELSAEINEIYETIVKNTQHAENAGKVALESSAEVDKSNIKMNEMLSAMDAISNSSLEINKIIKVIDDIAFQTNILALNAAVEAARAGSAGKGFAVVADEVRNLAGKSSEAAKQTTTLIENSISAIKKGTTLADETGKSLSGIVSKTKLTSDLITEIVHASTQQTVSINQIKFGIEQISSVIQENAATAEASAANSEELSGQSQILTDLVNQFNVDKSKKHINK